jgi:predicted permease
MTMMALMMMMTSIFRHHVPSCHVHYHSLYAIAMVSLSTNVQAALSGGTTVAAFRAAGLAMSELGVAGCIGAACVKKGALTQDTVRALSKTTFSILLPMFLSTGMIKTAGSLTQSSLAVPVLAVLNSFCLYVISKHVLLPLFQFDPDTLKGRATTVCCSWGNSGVVPLIFGEALFRNAHPSVLADCCAQISLYLVGWSPFFWSFGRSVLIGNDDTEKGSKDVEDSWRSMLESLRRLFPPPVIGVALGLITALTPLRKLFVATNNNKAPLAVVYNSFQNLGRAANPLALLVLTASLALGRTSGRNVDELSLSSLEVDGAPKEIVRRWACVSVARYILSPLFMLSLLKLAAKFGRIGSSKTDPMLWFVLLLQSCMPSAQNSVLMLQVAGKGEEASAMAKFLFSIYFTAMLPVVLIVTVALQKLGLT